jgi:dCMP deaminase
MRSEWSETWLDVAHAVGKRSACHRRQAGTVIVDESNRILSTGYNGAPAGFRTVPDIETDHGLLKSELIGHYGDCRDFCPRAQAAEGGIEQPKSYDDCVAVHSEANALAYADPLRMIGGVAYTVPGCPCFGCAKLLAGAKLAAVVFNITELDRGRMPEQSIEFFLQCNVQPIIVTALEEFKFSVRRLGLEALQWR